LHCETKQVSVAIPAPARVTGPILPVAVDACKAREKPAGKQERI